MRVYVVFCVNFKKKKKKNDKLELCDFSNIFVFVDRGKPL